MVAGRWQAEAAESTRKLLQGHIAQGIGREAQQASQAALHHDLAVVAEVAAHQFAQHPQSTSHAVSFLDQAAAGGGGELAAGILQTTGQLWVVTGSRLDACL